ncbi:PspC domain-containing protein [candidate division KSB1 bacterium]
MSEKKSSGGKTSEKKEPKTENTTPPKSETSAGSPGYRPLYRSLTNRMLGGVCGGLAEYFSIDPTIIRILFVASTFVGIGIIAYIVCWIIIPEGEQTAGTASSPVYSGSGSGGAVAGLVIGAIIVLIGLGLLLDNMNDLFYMPRWLRHLYSFETLLGVMLIGLGIFVVIHMMKKKEEEDTVPLTGPPKSTGKTEPKAEAKPRQQGTLYRSRVDRKIAGVCGGLGEYFNIDPTIVRIVMVVFILFSQIFPGLIIYFIMAVVIPETPMIQEDTV